MIDVESAAVQPTVVLERQDQGVVLRGMKVAYISIDTLLPWSNAQTKEPRTDAERARRRSLPLPPIANKPGGPRYLINTIELLDEHEDLRDTVRALFGADIASCLIRRF